MSCPQEPTSSFARFPVSQFPGSPGPPSVLVEHVGGGVGPAPGAAAVAVRQYVVHHLGLSGGNGGLVLEVGLVCDDVLGGGAVQHEDQRHGVLVLHHEGDAAVACAVPVQHDLPLLEGGLLALRLDGQLHSLLVGGGVEHHRLESESTRAVHTQHRRPAALELHPRAIPQYAELRTELLLISASMLKHELLGSEETVLGQAGCVGGFEFVQEPLEGCLLHGRALGAHHVLVQLGATQEAVVVVVHAVE
mmetsp:Transcript_23853/g.52998  ORF Transcript_23853/g.52998 Transcript_23853/m.52998 type:complete len:248 (-) Transcript_23853:812-1555(-)